MKIFISFILLTCFIATKGQDLFIKGKVVDSSTGEPLPGATVQISNSTYGTITDVSGEFALRVADTTKALLVRYIGYKDQPVSIGNESTINLTIQMAELTNELSEVFIFANLQGQQKALNQQKNAPNIKNIISADQIGRFPDPNVAEALQRVPGTTLQRDQGEGRYIIVRGLSPQFTNISINGEQIPSPEAGVRFVALDAIPSDQLSSIEVNKALMPDLDGDAIGGSVNLITRKAKSSQLEAQGSLVGGYNQLMGEPNGQSSLLLGKRFGADEKLGVLVNLSHYYTDRGSDNWEKDGDDLELRDYELRRTRSSASATLDYRINARNEVYIRTINSSFTDREWRRRYVFVPNVDNSPFEQNEIERLTKDRFERQDIVSYNVGGRHYLSKLNIDYEFAYAKALQDTPFDNEVNFIGEPDELNINFSNNQFPSFSTNADFDYLDNSNYEFDELEAGRTYSQDVNLTGKINLSLPYTLNGNSGIIKTGVKYRAKTKDLSVVNSKFGWAGGDVSFNGLEGDFTLEKFAGGLVDKRFLNNRYRLSASPDIDQVINFFNANKSGFELEAEDKLVDENVESYQATEDVTAAYLMTDLQINKLQLVAGVRYEHTQVNYQFNTILFDDEGDLDEIVADQGSTSYDFLLPQLNLRYVLSNFTNLRGAITYSYARPNFESIVPSQEINVADREGTIGNATLKPVSALNIDLMVDHYFGTVGVLSAGLFHKNLDNFIYRRTQITDTYNGINFDRQLRLRQDVNGSTARLTGLELAYQQNLTFLPGILSGISVYANYTYTHSAATLTDRTEIGDSEKVRLPGQASHVGNFSLGYEIKRFNIRASANYAGSYLEELGEDPEEDRTILGRLQLDATASYNINNKAILFAEVINLGNAPFEASLGSKSNIVQREFYSWWSRVGLKFNF